MKLLYPLTTVLLWLNGFGALYGGWHLMKDPTGSSIQLPAEYIADTLFKNYFIPGLVLFVMNGMLSLLFSFFVIKRSPLAGRLVIFQGLVLVTWLMVQLITIKVTFILQLIFGIIGILFILLGWIIMKSKTNQINLS